jgi:hypothetical protein
MLRLRPGLVSFLLTATALAGGPGLTLGEAWQHTHRTGPAHSHYAHYEARGGQDHDDRCEIGLISVPARAPSAGSAELRLPTPEPKALAEQLVSSAAQVTGLLPPSRAPPAVL